VWEQVETKQEMHQVYGSRHGDGDALAWAGWSIKHTYSHWRTQCMMAVIERKNG